MIQDHSHFSAAQAYRGDVGDRVNRFLPMVRKLAWHLSGSGGPTVEVDDLVQAGLVALPDRHQLVIQLYFVEELNLSEIAAVLGVSVPRVHQLKASALDKIKAEFAGRS